MKQKPVKSLSLSNSISFSCSFSNFAPDADTFAVILASVDRSVVFISLSALMASASLSLALTADSGPF